MNMITGFCGKRPFFLAAGKTRSCGNLVIQVKHSSATFTTPEWQSTVRCNQVYDRLWGAKHRLDVSLRAIDGRMVAPGQTPDPPRYEATTWEAIAAILAKRSASAIDIHEQGARISLAGAQDKTSLAIFDDGIPRLPKGTSERFQLT